MKIPQNIIRSISEFPTLPTIYTELTNVMDNPRSTTLDAANIICRDQSSVTKILKAANSSIYGFRGKIDTVSQAIFHIGFDEVKNLIISLAIMDLFKKTKINEYINPVDLWKHSIATGAITRIFGREMGIQRLENYFVAGVIHDIGKLFFLRYYPNEYSEVLSLLQEKNISIRDAESEVLGVTHPIVGGLIASAWKLPPSIANSISYHHIGTVEGTQVDPLVGSVHLANIVARALELGNAGDNLVPQPNPIVVESMKFEDNILTKKLYDRALLDYEESVSLFLLN